MGTTQKRDDPPESTTASITVQDVLDFGPREDASETRVFESLEQNYDEEKGKISTGILTGMPQRPSLRNLYQAETKNSTVEDSLRFLTDAMMSHAGGGQNNNHGNAMFAVEEEEEPTEPQVGQDEKQEEKKKHHFKTQADLFVDNAVRLKKMSSKVTRFSLQIRRFLAFRQDSLLLYLKSTLLYLILPGLAFTVLFYYAWGNPMGSSGATVSWWINFVVVRNVLTLTLAKATEVVLIDFLCISTPFFMNVAGSFNTLILVQSKGWPFQLMAWAAYNFAMLYGNSRFANHWLFYQKAMEVFNENNSSGDVTNAESWERILASAVVIGGSVCLKRFFCSLHYGTGVYRQYGKDLASVMNKAVLIGKVAALAKDENAVSKAQHFELDFEKLGKGNDEETDDDDDVSSSYFVFQTDPKDVYSSGLSHSQRAKIVDLLGEWEEPNIDQRKIDVVPISAIVQFRAAVTCIDNDYPFSIYFGVADKRESCIGSSQKLFLRLDTSDGHDGLIKFDTLAVVALKKDGTLDEQKLKELIRIFRPTRDGELTMLEFVKSIDAVYKELRVIHASILNANRMNAASQRLVDVAFYFILGWIVLGMLGVDQAALFGSVVGFIVGFAFMIGGASSKYFEGLLFVLVRKPFDIGDRVAVSDVQKDVSGSGSSGWIVKDLDLYKTTVVFGTTNEEATYSNGSLASSRIINHNRSPQASLNFVVRFTIDVDKDKVKAFAAAVEQYVKDRPREWLSFGAFRLSNVCPDLNYVEYKVIVKHRESWQQIGAILTSKAALQLFAYELSNDMQLIYESPPMPIILSSRTEDRQQGNGAANDAFQLAANS